MSLINFFGTKYLKFIVIGCFGAITNIIILYGLTEWFGVWYILSFIIGAICGSIVNYTGSKIIVFKDEQ